MFLFSLIRVVIRIEISVMIKGILPFLAFNLKLPNQSIACVSIFSYIILMLYLY